MVTNCKECISNIRSKLDDLILGKKHPKKERPQNSAPDEQTGKCPPSKVDDDLCYPTLTKDFFERLRTTKHWWAELRTFLVFIVLAGLATFVFYKCINPMVDNKSIPDGYLLFYFGVFAIVFVGLVVVALFIIKASAKHRAEQDERDNKTMAFRQKMLESAFALVNREYIAEKNCIEKAILLSEKDFVMKMDEEQREAEFRQKMQLKQYEIIDNYMKYEVELVKSGQQKLEDIKNLSVINQEKQPKSNEIIDNYMKYVLELVKAGQQKLGEMNLLNILSIINKGTQSAQGNECAQEKYA